MLVGYRYDHATETKPLFPFGFGLSYTTFSYHDLKVAPVPGGYRLTVRMRNTGRRTGADVVQAYMTFPKAAREPPGQLAAFAPVTLAPGAVRTVTLTVPAGQLATFQSSRVDHGPGHLHDRGRRQLGVPADPRRADGGRGR